MSNSTTRFGVLVPSHGSHGTILRKIICLRRRAQSGGADNHAAEAAYPYSTQESKPVGLYGGIEFASGR